MSTGAPEQLDLLSREDSTLVRDELLAKLAQEDEDLARKQTAGAKRKREAAALLAYMKDGTTTLGEAAQEWREHRPGGDAS